MQRTYLYAAMTKDEAQSAAADRMTFYESVNIVISAVRCSLSFEMNDFSGLIQIDDNRRKLYRRKLIFSSG